MDYIQSFSERHSIKRRSERERKLALIFALKIMFFQQKWHEKSMVLFRIFLKFPDIRKPVS